MNGLRCLVYSEDDAVQARVVRALRETRQAALLPPVRGRGGLADVLRTSQIDVLYVDLGSEPRELLELLEKLEQPRPALLLGGPRDNAELLLRAMRLQPLEFFVDHELGDSLAALLERLARERSPAAERRAPRCTLAIAGAKGGVGATLLTCELAAALQRLGQRVVVVDLNLHGGDVALHFDLAPPHGLAEIAKKGESLDEAFLHSVLAPHVGGVRVLAAPAEPENAGLIGAAHVERALRLLGQLFDWVILDLPVNWEHVGLRAVHGSDLILVVATPDVPALTHTRRKLELLERFGAPSERVRVVLNRHRSGTSFGLREVREALGREVDAWLPTDESAALASVNEGKLLHEVEPSGKLARAFDQLAEQVFAWSSGKPPPARKPATLLGKLRHYVAGD
jgi:pilus assembly protein CpaE